MEPQTPGDYDPLIAAPRQGQWSTGLCDCMSDVPTCCLTCWCPWITFGQIAEIIDKGVTSCGVGGVLYTLVAVVFGCPCFYSCTYRTKLKQQYGIPTSCVEECCVHFWCHWCALCQEYRELQHHGFDVPLGWHGNMERMNRGTEATSPPVKQGGMTR